MSQIQYRGNVASQHFPFLAKSHGRTIIVPQQDQAFASNVLQNPTDQDQDKGIPQYYYMHNVMPSSEGLQSIGYTPRITGLPGATNFNGIFLLRDINENKFLFSPAGGANFIYDGDIQQWVNNSPISIPSNALITVAYLNGNTYVFFQNVGLFQYDTTAKALIAVAVTGIDVTEINGITASNGFLIMYDEFTVYRSQITNPLDFTVDTSLGSGSSIPADIAGQIVACLPIINGFIIYTTKNAVGASFTQNTIYPFVYKEIEDSAGIADIAHVSWQDNSGVHYAWTQAGLMKVNKTTAALVFPDATDFIAAKLFEEFDETLNQFTYTTLTTQLKIRVCIVGRRFLVLSYGLTSFTYALVYDFAFKRWGKLKINHVAAFEYIIPNMYGAVSWNQLSPLAWTDLGDTTWADLGTQVSTFEQPKETLAFLMQDGSVSTVDFDDIHGGDDGVCIFGKYQYVRTRFLILDEVEIELAEATDNFNLLVLPSIDGKNLLPAVVPYLAESVGAYRRYMMNIEAKNHTLVAKGTFRFNSLLLTFHPGGHA